MCSQCSFSEYIVKTTFHMIHFLIIQTIPVINEAFESLELYRKDISHGAPQVNLKEQGQLIRQDEFMVTFRKKKCFRHVFLFQELVLFSKTRKTDVGNDTYIYKQSFKVRMPMLTSLGLPVNTVCVLVVTFQTAQLCCNTMTQESPKGPSPQLGPHDWRSFFPIR